MSQDAAREETDLALEYLSVTIGGIAEQIADLAAGPPTAPQTYASLADWLQAAGADIGTLSAAMAVLARRSLESLPCAPSAADPVCGD